nr:tegumental antigen [Hymenolepis microstoma]
MNTGGGIVVDFNDSDPFTQAFYEIDTDSDGIITRADLEQFVRNNDFVDKNLVKSWMKLFDTSESDLITIQLYKKKLGLPDDERDRTNSSHSSFPEPPSYANMRASEIRIISASMPAINQAEVIEESCRLIATNTEGSNSFSGGSRTIKFNESQTAANLRQWLELRFGRVWHVIIVQGSYWMHYSHEIDCSLQFQIGSHVFLLWRTPSD